ncbi:hypothetical protein Taro_050831 [Colocasia esculenta]|uniref:Uncharacterized protein n=1 Tax=Colocasia esculenta TaxID=4460 RepID=A0A843XF48_COLES|nr:hypothetical protein [Colocasia esculenta]
MALRGNTYPLSVSRKVSIIYFKGLDNGTRGLKTSPLTASQLGGEGDFVAYVKPPPPRFHLRFDQRDFPFERFVGDFLASSRSRFCSPSLRVSPGFAGEVIGWTGVSSIGFVLDSRQRPLSPSGGVLETDTSSLPPSVTALAAPAPPPSFGDVSGMLVLSLFQSRSTVVPCITTQFE